MTETLQVRDRWDGGLTWTLADDRMERSSHALALQDGVWLVDPVDAPGLDEAVSELGEVAGVVVLLDRHTRDAGAIAARHGVPVSLPETLSAARSKVDGRVETFAGSLPGTDVEAIPLVSNPIWNEVALWHAASGTLVVPESLGTGEFFTVGDRPLGVHAVRRLTPPRDQLRDCRPRRVLVGHGDPVTEDAAEALQDALRASRRDAPAAFLGAAKVFLG